jgi:hypothetical protein
MLLGFALVIGVILVPLILIGIMAGIAGMRG